MVEDQRTFTAHVIHGSHRGRQLGSPTLNLNLSEVPKDIPEGIYACRVSLGDSLELLPAVMHYGPRPVFDDSVSCEIHVLDRAIPSPPPTVTVHTLERIRDVTDFPLREVLQEQIQADIAVARGILGLSL